MISDSQTLVHTVKIGIWPISRAFAPPIMSMGLPLEWYQFDDPWSLKMGGHLSYNLNAFSASGYRVDRAHDAESMGSCADTRCIPGK